MKKLGIEILKEIYATLFEAVDDVKNLNNEYPMIAKPISIAIGTLDEAIETDDDWIKETTSLFCSEAYIKGKLREIETLLMVARSVGGTYFMSGKDDDSPFWESLNHPITEGAVGGAMAIIGAVNAGDIEIEEPEWATKWKND